MSKDILKEIIIRSVRSLVSTPVFSDWFKQQGANDGDIVVINNSFIYRKPLIKTSKNAQYLSLKVKGTELDPGDIQVGRAGDMDLDFKLLCTKSGNLPSLESLDEALQTEMNRLGQLVFVLIGELRDVPATVPINHSYARELGFKPSAGSQAVIEDVDGGNKVIVVNQLNNPESAWVAIKPELEQVLGNDFSDLETAFGAAFEKLQEEARLRLLLPSSSASETSNSFMARLRESVSEQRKLYEAALRQWASGSGAANGHLREGMRIAYNFADDAIKLLQLLVSTADLKGVLLWCTIKEHFDVAEAFRNLPWTKSRGKASLEQYRKIIRGARNRAFHSLFAFDRTIEADLENVDVKARLLTLLPAHGRRKTTVPFDYEDREMVEILTQLTRAPEITVSFDFWKKNAAVMESFEKLLAHTEKALWALNHARKR